MMKSEKRRKKENIKNIMKIIQAMEIAKMDNSADNDNIPISILTMMNNI